MVLPAPTVWANAPVQRNLAEHKSEGRLSGKCRWGEFLRIAQEQTIFFEKFQSIEQFKQELAYNTVRIKLSLGGLTPAVYLKKCALSNECFRFVQHLEPIQMRKEQKGKLKKSFCQLRSWALF